MVFFRPRPKKFSTFFKIRIFLQHPELKFIWKFAANLQTEEEFRNSSSLKSHGYKVVESLNTYVNALDKMESLDKLLFDLGSRHASYGDGKILISYFDVKEFYF
jgi:hypothetical protein